MSENKENLTEQQWVDAARYSLIKDHDTKEACMRYFKAQELNPDNAEAAFFVDLLAYESLREENDRTTASKAFRSMAKNAAVSVRGTKENANSDPVFDSFIASAIAVEFTPITRYVITTLRWMSADNLEAGVLGLYALGDALKELFEDSETMMKLAVDAWKEGVALQRQFYAYKYDGVVPEDYAAKIQKVDPAYTMPNKSGCISLAK